MKFKLGLLGLLGILVIAGFLRLYLLGDFPPGLYPDEAMNGNNVLEKEFKVFYPENGGREGLFINIQALFLALIGKNEPWALRLPSAIFGILTVLGLYFLVKELLNKKIALLSAFLLATSFWHINFSRIGFRAILAPFFLIWGLYLLFLTFRKLNASKSQISNLKSQINSNTQNSKTKKFWILAILSGLVYGLGFYTYIAFRATPFLLIPFGYVLLRQTRDKQRLLKGGFVFLAATFIVVLPLAIYFLNNPDDFLGRTGQISIFNSPTPIKDLGLNILKTSGMFNISGDWNWRHNVAGQPLLFWPVGLLFLIGLGVAIRKYRFPVWWLLVAALPVVISNEGIPHALRSILMAPAVFMIAGIGGVWFYERVLIKLRDFLKVRKWIINGFVGLFISLLILEAYFTYFVTWGQNPNVAGAFNQNYLEIGRELNTLPKELGKYVIVKAPGVDVRGIPMPAQTVMFITDTFSPEKQKEKNIYYLLPDQALLIPKNSYIAVLE